MRAAATVGLLLLIASASVAAQKPAPRQASFEFFIINLRNVDSVAETFEADYYLNTLWNEPGMQSEPADWATVWNPMVDSVNAVNPGKQWEFYRLVSPGQVRAEARFASTYQAPMDLRKFPFDRQVLPIIIESSKYRVDEVRFLYETKSGQSVLPTRPLEVKRDLALNPEIHLPEWTIDAVRVRERVAHLGFEGTDWSQFRIELLVSRNYGFYLWRVFMIQILIVALAFLVHVADPLAFGDRMSFSLTLFLAAVAFSFITAGLIPRISYLTLLDVFMLGSYAVIFISVAENAMVYRLASRGRMDAAHRLDRMTLVVMPIAFALFLGWIALTASR